MNKRIQALLMGAALLAMTAAPASAAKLDAYRDMMAQRSCTIAYENITPPERQHNKDKVELSFMWDARDMATAPQYVSQSYHGILVLGGTDSYEELDYGTYASCRLTKDGKVYNFARTSEQKKRSELENAVAGTMFGIFVKQKRKMVDTYYSARGKGRIEGQLVDAAGRLIYGESYGDSDVTRLLTLLLPPTQKPLGTPVYEPVGAGQLANGQSYEDYRSRAGEDIEAVRFYFDDARLVRIASIIYRTEGGVVRTRKCILRVDRFEPTPETELLALPAGLTEVK